MEKRKYRIIETAGDTLDKDPSWGWDSNDSYTEGYVLWLVRSGRGSLDSPFGRFQLKKGDCFIMPFPGLYRGRQDPEKLIVIPWILFRVVPLPTSSVPGPLDIDCNPETWRSFKDPVHLGNMVLPFYRQIRNFYFLDMLLSRALSYPQHSAERIILLESFLQELKNHDYSRPADSVNKRINDIISAIDSRPENYGRLEDLDPGGEYSTDHFIRLFKKHTALTPKEYIIRRRMEKAVSLLLLSNLGISDIAARTGYSDVYTFSKQFRARQGLSPLKYRQGNRS